MKDLKKSIPVVLLFVAVMALSSCNRGLGCPNNFSISETVVKCVVELPSVVWCINEE